MGAEVQQKCEECLNCSNANDIEFKKDENNNPNYDISKNLRSKGLRPYENDMTFIENDIAKAVTIIINPKIYEKMLNGEKLHLILEPLTNFNNKNLYEIIRELFIKISELKKNENNSVFLYYEKIYKDLYNKGIINNLINFDLGFFTNIKFKLIYVIEIITEIFHYFKYHLSDGFHPYNIHYWENIKNTVNYMKEKINDFNQCLNEINNFIYENKSKNINHGLNIHITTNNFNMQFEQ